jgi:hypothetical protein
MKKYGIYRLLAGLMVLTSNCSPDPFVLELQAVKHLPHFPSASGIEYSNQRFYLFGDDAAYALVLDTAFIPLDTIRYNRDTLYRVAKERKDDLESAALMHLQGTTSVVAFGSLSTTNRQTAFSFPLHDPHRFKPIPLSGLTQALHNIKDLNIEGAAVVGSKLVLANRAHQQQRVNELAVLGIGEPQRDGAVLIKVRLKQTKLGAGISGLYYLAAKDWLLFTASEEATANTYADGAIGNSYLGWIDRFSKQLQQQTAIPDAFIPLQTVDERFHNQKIEGICVMHSNEKGTTLVLAADNDDGKSTLFKVTLYH